MSTPEPTPVAAQSESYACPKCGGKMNFDAAKGTVVVSVLRAHHARAASGAQQATIPSTIWKRR